MAEVKHVLFAWMISILAAASFVVSLICLNDDSVLPSYTVICGWGCYGIEEIQCQEILDFKIPK